MRTDYYVYGHYLKGSNELFYIGKGTRDRATILSNRSPAWHLKVKDKEWYAVILFSGMTSKDALDKEYELISMFRQRLINIVLQKRTDPVLQDLNDNFYYDQTSPTGLRWKVWNRSHGKTKRNAGDVAGHVKFSDGAKSCNTVRLRDTVFQTTWIIWYLVHGEYPDSDFVIDHIDGNPHNNNVENLRLVSHACNSRNRTKQINNKSGVAGVYRMNNGCGKDYIVGKVTINGKNIQKYFDVAKYGESEAFHLACEWRSTQIALLNDQGAGYTSRHGQ